MSSIIVYKLKLIDPLHLFLRLFGEVYNMYVIVDSTTKKVLLSCYSYYPKMFKAFDTCSIEDVLSLSIVQEAEKSSPIPMDVSKIKKDIAQWQDKTKIQLFLKHYLIYAHPCLTEFFTILGSYSFFNTLSFTSIPLTKKNPVNIEVVEIKSLLLLAAGQAVELMEDKNMSRIMEGMIKKDDVIEWDSMDVQYIHNPKLAHDKIVVYHKKEVSSIEWRDSNDS